MNKLFIATIAIGLFLMSTPALGVEKALKVEKPEKSKRVTLNFDAKKDAKAPVAKAKTKKVASKPVANKNYRSIYCQDGYVVKNHAYCLISAKPKPAKMVAKKQPVKVVKPQRSVASQKDLTTSKRR